LQEIEVFHQRVVAIGVELEGAPGKGEAGRLCGRRERLVD
jgi:hypothetical protein